MTLKLPKKDHQLPNCPVCEGSQVTQYRNAQFERRYRACHFCGGTGNYPVALTGSPPVAHRIVVDLMAQLEDKG
jgi:hypothetical protein